MARRECDLYETAPWQVDALTDHVPEISGAIWCPTVGDGALLRRLQINRPDLGPFVTNDIDPRQPADYHLDATDDTSWLTMALDHGRPDFVIDNPPFGVAIDIVKHALAFARLGVILMARVSFVEGTKDAKKRPRGQWLSTHPRLKQIVLERYSFTGNGQSDSTTTEWLVWSKIPMANPGGHTAFGYKGRSAEEQDAAIAVRRLADITATPSNVVRGTT